MKFLFMIFMLMCTCTTAQRLNVRQIHQIGLHTFDELDKLMVNQHKFKRVEDVEDDNQRVYTNDSDQLDQLLVVTVIRDLKGCANVLSIVDKSAANVFQLKKDLPQEGFVYMGKKKMSEELIVSQFQNGKVHILLSDTITSAGAYQILLMCR